MILSEENNQEKILTDRVLDVHHEQENMPSANGKASPWSRSLSGSRLTIQSVRGCWDLSPKHHVVLCYCEGRVSSRAQKAVLTSQIARKYCVPSLPKPGCVRLPFPLRDPPTAL